MTFHYFNVCNYSHWLRLSPVSQIKSLTITKRLVVWATVPQLGAGAVAVTRLGRRVDRGVVKDMLNHTPWISAVKKEKIRITQPASRL